MDAYTTWNLPQGLDSDFLSVLSKQLNPHSNHLVNPLLQQQLNPQSILQDASPPLTEDSASPSPPAPIGRGLARPPPAPTADNRNQSALSNDEMHKRKHHDSIDDDDDDEDDFEGQPQYKNHKDQPGKKTTKRKSGGDESRQLKRKEQNRAAQRAFRERKEKHVKDLEDQVAALEEKSASQLQENENLRDLLGRLQNENLMLKQSAFTFNMQRSGNTKATDTSATVTGSRTTPSSQTSPVDSTSKSTSSPGSAVGRNDSSATSHQQPSGMFETNPSTASYTPLLGFNGGNSASGNPTGSANQVVPSPSTSLGDMPLSFFSPPPPPSMNIQPSPYTTIASNPMYTSYTDFGAWDQFFANGGLDPTWSGIGDVSASGAESGGAGSGTPGRTNSGDVAGSSGNGGMEDLFSSTGNFSDLIAFSSFSPTTSPLGAFGANGNGGNMISPSVSPIARATTSGVPNNTNSGAFSLSSRDATAPSIAPPAPAPRSSSPCGGAEPDEAARPCSANYRPQFSNGMSVSPTGNNSVGLAGPSTAHTPSNCSEAINMSIGKEPLTTLGGHADGVPNSGGPCDGLGLPELSEKKKMKLKEVWNTIKSHPQFEECDMDDLCRELSQKVRCDGSTPVMDASETPCEQMVENVIKEVADRSQKRKSNAGLANSRNDSSSSINKKATQQQAPTSPLVRDPIAAQTMTITPTPAPALTTMPEPLTQADRDRLQFLAGSDAAMMAVRNFLTSFGGPGAGLQMLKIQQQMNYQGQPQMPVPPRTNSESSTSPSNVLSPTSLSSFGQAMDLSSHTSPPTSQPQQPKPQPTSSFFPPEASWSNMLLDAPSPNTQFMNMMGENAGTGSGAVEPSATNTMTGMMSPSAYFNFGSADKE